LIITFSKPSVAMKTLPKHAALDNLRLLALPTIAMTITIGVGFYMYPAYLHKARNLLVAAVFSCFISKVIAVPFLYGMIGRLGRCNQLALQKEPTVSGELADVGDKITRSDFFSPLSRLRVFTLGALAWGIISSSRLPHPTE
jgi:hypothetical protein